MRISLVLFYKREVQQTSNKLEEISDKEEDPVKKEISDATATLLEIES
jgi:hypothetical protein